MSTPMDCQLIGRWRIVEADIWDRDHLDLVEPAMIVIEADGHGEIASGAMQAGLDLEYARTLVFFTWAGFDEGDQVTGSGSPTTSATRQPSRPSASIVQQPASSSEMLVTLASLPRSR